MKRISIVFRLCLCTMFMAVLSSCIPDKNTETDVSNQIIIAGDLNGVTQGSLSQQQYAADDFGVYEIICWTSGDANILYSDKSTNIRTFLSSDLTIPSNDESNTSLIKSWTNGSSIFIAGDYLYILGRGYSYEEYTRENEIKYIQQRKKNGEITNEFRLAANDVFDENGIFAYDGQYIYFKCITYEYEDGNTVNAQTSIVRLDESSFTEEKIFIFPSEISSMSIKSAYDDYLILEGRMYDPEKEEFYWAICKLNICKESYEPVHVSREYTVKRYIGDQAFYLDYLESVAKVYTIDLRERKEPKLLSSFDLGRVDRCELTGGVYDDMLYMFTYDSYQGVSHHYVFDPKDQQLTELTIYRAGRDPETKDWFVGPFEECGDRFFVILGEKTVKFYDIAPDHVTRFLSERTDYDYAWIQKCDYYKNDPKFVSIKTMIEYR